MQFDVGGRNVYAYTGGRKFDASLPALVFVHGAQHDHSVWRLQSRYFAHHGAAVLAPDLPGHGRSEGPPLPGVDTLADWLVRVMDATGVTCAALVGHSMGSLVVLETAARVPERVQRIVLIGASAPMPVAEDLLEAARCDEPHAMTMINLWSHGPRAQIGGNTVPGMWMTGANRALMRRQNRGVLYTDLAACNDYLQGLDSASRVACPALLVVGSRDQMTPPAAAQTLRDALPDARSVTLEGAGHALMAEQPDNVLDVLRAFL
jgi:pimeloyl-ACP methyl ester carboxylesterase